MIDIEVLGGLVSDMHGIDDYLIVDWDNRETDDVCVICFEEPVKDKCPVCGFRNESYEDPAEFMRPYQRMKEIQHKTSR